uniref:Uncharacterized protein n=1 Tax=Ditylum brightwellii TaxID=49249 RepID=A0A7S4VPP6_9STRA|mmetsp:Transcript_28584/g.38053  ORF Transcript_28584/g.38053 Transcript_28584/m.38053 type:complete len:162 (-) Transcript_28584:415-900(-)
MKSVLVFMMLSSAFGKGAKVLRTAEDAVATSDSCLSVKIGILTDNYPEQTNWFISAKDGSVVVSGGDYTESATSYVQHQCLEAEIFYTFHISDTDGDGSGSYQLSLGKKTFIEEEGFNSSMQHKFMLADTDIVIVTPKRKYANEGNAILVSESKLAGKTTD